MAAVRQRTTSLFAIAVVATADLLLRFGDELLGIFFSSVFLGIEAGILDVSQWIVLVTALAVFAPKLYPGPMGKLVEPLPFRLLVAGTATGMAAVLADFHELADVGWMFAIALGFGIAFSVLLRSHDVPVFDVESPLVYGLERYALGEGVARDELERATEYGGWTGRLALGVFATATYAVFLVPILVSGIVVEVLLELAPLTDFLVLTYAIASILATRVDRLPAPPSALELDAQFLSLARHGYRGIHGFFVVLLFAVGVFITISTPVAALYPAFELLLASFRPPATPLLSWNVVGLVLLYLLATGYGLWFWARMVPRAATFLERWNDEERETSLEPVPRSLLLPTFVATGVATAGLSNGFLAGNRHLFAATWPLPVLTIAWVVWRTRRRPAVTRREDGSVARREDVTVVAAVLIAYFTLMGNVALVRNDLAVLFSPSVGLFCGIVLFASAVGRVSRYGDRHDRRYGDCDDERRLALPLYLAVGGLFALVATGHFTGALEALLAVSGVTMLGFGAALGVTKYYYL